MNLPKSPSGIDGLDEVTHGGFPKNRSTIICGAPGTGKTLFGIHFLAQGVRDFDEPGVLVSFEETADALVTNVRNLGFDLNSMIAQNKLVIEEIRFALDSSIEGTSWSLEPIWIRVKHAIESVGAKRVLIDTPDALLPLTGASAYARSELVRFFQRLLALDVTLLVTAEAGKNTLTRNGFEEYISDCVIRLDNRVFDEVSTRRLRVVKYRGGSHDTNEVPFIIGDQGVSVIPLTSMSLEYEVGQERISTGLADLDNMLGGGGYYKGSSILVCGSAGTGKTSIGAHFLKAACDRGEAAVAFLFEESVSQYVRNMASIGLDVQAHIDSGLLHFVSARPYAASMEEHLLAIRSKVLSVRPNVLVIDPLSNLDRIGSTSQVSNLLYRICDFLKHEGVTSLFSSMTSEQNPTHSEVAISSLMDTWLMVRNLETNGERNRLIYVMKARGTHHSNQVREFKLSSTGIKFDDVYLGAGKVLAGTARKAQEELDRQAQAARALEVATDQRKRQRRIAALEAKLAEINFELETVKDEQAKVDMDYETFEQGIRKFNKQMEAERK